jgi:hypothetical protein
MAKKKGAAGGGDLQARALLNVLGRGKELEAGELAGEVLEAAGVVAGLCDAAMDANRQDVEAVLEDARSKLFEAAELLRKPKA